MNIAKSTEHIYRHSVEASSYVHD